MSTKKIGESNELSGLTKQIANRLNMYKFRERLKYKCKIKNNLIIANEWNTSVCCSNCGNKKLDLGGKKEYKCEKCKKDYDRDVNASKNILMKVI